MPNNIGLKDFENLLILKNQLITLSKEKLIELYSDISNYILFLDTIICMFNEESAFLYLDDDFADKIHSIIQIYRFDIDDSEIVDRMNIITKCINDVESTDDNYKKLLVNSYKEYQQDIRSVNYKTDYDFIYSLSFDAIVFLGLKGVIEIPSTDNTVLRSSMSYIADCCPEFFLDADIYNRSCELLDDISSGCNIFSLDTKILTKEVKKRIKRINMKGE